VIVISDFGFFVKVCVQNRMKKTKDYINLLPPEERKPGRAFNYTVLLSCLFVLVWLAVFGWQGKQLRDLQSRFDTLTMKKQALQGQLAQIYKDLGIVLPAGTSPEKAWLIQSILSERVLWSDVFKQFSLIVPRGLWFDSLEGSSVGKAEIKIRGGAFNYRTISEFMLAMEKTGFFEKPQLVFMQKAMLQGQETVGFEITCGIMARGAR
jgi:Tfp pilus assembly protein PilN